MAILPPMFRAWSLLVALCASAPALAVNVAVFPTGDASVDRALQAAAEGRPEVTMISLAQVREEMNAVTIKGVDCALPTEACLVVLGPELGAEWILTPRKTTDVDVTIGLFDLATQLELLKTEARLVASEDELVTNFDRALGRLFNPQAAGSIEVTTEAGNRVFLDDDKTAKLGPKAVFDEVAPGAHTVIVQAPDGREERVVVEVNGASVTSAAITLPEKSRPLLLVGGVTLGAGAAVIVLGAVMAGTMQAMIRPLYVGSPEDRETFRLLGLVGMGVVGLGVVPAVAGGVMTGVGLLVE